MLAVFEELAQITAAELTEVLDGVEQIDCTGAAFTQEHGAFCICWVITLSWASLPASLTLRQSDLELGEDWLIERFTRCILDEISTAQAFVLSGCEAVA